MEEKERVALGEKGLGEMYRCRVKLPMTKLVELF